MTMSHQEREHAKACAMYAGRNILNGPTAGELKKAALGENEDLLEAVHLILQFDKRVRKESAVF